MNRILQRAAADRRTLSRPTKERPTKGRQEEATLGFRQARSCARDAARGGADDGQLPFFVVVGAAAELRFFRTGAAAAQMMSAALRLGALCASFIVRFRPRPCPPVRPFDRLLLRPRSSV